MQSDIGRAVGTISGIAYPECGTYLVGNSGKATGPQMGRDISLRIPEVTGCA